MKIARPFVADVIEATGKIEELLRGFDRQRFGRDERTQLAIIKLLEIIGEACLRLETEFHRKHKEIPWPKIISMRNRLTHAYWDIDLDIVWKTAKERVPELREQLKALAV